MSSALLGVSDVLCLADDFGDDCVERIFPQRFDAPFSTFKHNSTDNI